MNILENKETTPGVATPSSAIFITGGTGFLGAYVIRDLVLAGYSVKALRRNKNIPSFIEPSIFDNVEWIDGDIMDPSILEEAMENVCGVIHAAAMVSFSKKNRLQLYNINIEGTANVVNAALEKNVRRFIHVSSVAAIGKSKNSAEVTEETKWRDDKLNTHYGVSKYLSEMEVWRGFAEGLQSAIVNPSTILGYGDWNTSSCALFKKVYDGFPWYTKGTTGFVDVEDVSRSIVRLLATNISGERFIINGDNWTYHKLLETIADGFDKKRPNKEATPFLAELAWRVEKLRSALTGKKLLITKESARVAQTATRYNSSKILKALPGFAFTNPAETVKKACLRYQGRN